jgi:hypothetical protein
MNDRETMRERLQARIPFSHVADYGDHLHLQVSGAGVCDFCEEPIVVLDGVRRASTYDANDCTIIVPGCPPFESLGAWTACPTCAGFIDADRWDALLDHAALRSSDTPQERADRALAHDAFRRAKR